MRVGRPNATICSRAVISAVSPEVQRRVSEPIQDEDEDEEEEGVMEVWEARNGSW